MNSFKKGFTLIELLVVIAIIGILSSIVMTSLASARVKGRDATRKQDIQSALNAMELHHLDTGSYLVSGTGYQGGGGVQDGTGLFSWADGGADYEIAVAQGLVTAGYLPSVIHDPLVPISEQEVGGHWGYLVYPGLNGNIDSSVCLVARLEDPSEADIQTITRGVYEPFQDYVTEAPFFMNYAKCIN